MATKQFTFEVENGLKIFATEFLPESDNQNKGIVLISHGLSEHSGRYARFAEALNKEGLIVYAHDQRGHGKTALTPDFVHVEEGGFEGTVDDIRRLFDIAISEHPSLPVFIFAHSMGTVFGRKYIQKYSSHGLKGIVLCGPVYLADSMKLLKEHSKAVAEKHGRKYVDIETIVMLFGSLNERLKPEKTPVDWITSDTAELDKYLQDPFCGQPQSIGYLSDFAKGFDVYDEENIKKIDKDLPILFITGDQDPVTNYAEGAAIAKTLYKKAGIQDVQLISYPGVRHELLNEVNRDEVTEDIVNWIKKHL